MHENPLDTYWAQHGTFCTASTITGTTTSQNVMEVCGIGAGEFYVACFTWAMLVVTGSGGTDEFPTATSVGENLLVTGLNLGAAFFWTTVLALFCDMVTNGNPERTEFQHTLDELEIFMANHNIPQDMRIRLREYFHQRKHVRVTERAFEVTRQLSTRLQTEVITLVYGSWLSRVPFLRACDETCLTHLAMALSPITFAPAESPPPLHFYFIKSGIVVIGSRMIRSDKFFGEEIILQPASLEKIEQFVPQCTTYVDAFALSRTDLWNILNRFPTCKRNVRKSAAWLALRLEIRRLGSSCLFSTQEVASSFFLGVSFAKERAREEQSERGLGEPSQPSQPSPSSASPRFEDRKMSGPCSLPRFNSTNHRASTAPRVTSVPEQGSGSMGPSSGDETDAPTLSAVMTMLTSLRDEVRDLRQEVRGGKGHSNEGAASSAAAEAASSAAPPPPAALPTLRTLHSKYGDLS